VPGAGALVLVLAAAGVVAGAALAAEPAWRIADEHRALEIGLRVTDVGGPWTDASSAGSPVKIDLGSVISTGLTGECAGPVPATKASVDIDVTGASQSTFAGPGEIVSIAALFKTSTVARMQMTGADLKPLGPCFVSELQKGLGTGSRVTLVGFAGRRLATGSPVSLAGRLTLRVTTKRPASALKRPTSTSSSLFYVDLVVEQGGRGLVETGYFGYAPPPTTLESRLAHISARRLSQYAA
jgi:hypothetical protein